MRCSPSSKVDEPDLRRLAGSTVDVCDAITARGERRSPKSSSPSNEEPLGSAAGRAHAQVGAIPIELTVHPGHDVQQLGAIRTEPWLARRGQFVKVVWAERSCGARVDGVRRSHEPVAENRLARRIDCRLADFTRRSADLTAPQLARRYNLVVDTAGSEPVRKLDVDDVRLRTTLYQRVEEARNSMLDAVRRAGGRPQSFPRGTFLMRQGDPASAGFVVDRGRLKVGRLLEDGSQVILKVAPSGDFIGLIETILELPYTRYARAITEAVAWRLDRARIIQLLEGDRQFARAMLIVTSARFLESQLSVAGLRAGPVRGRIVQLLMKLAHETAVGCRDGCVIELELDQEEMASIIGTTRQTVSSLLNSLEHAGLIRRGHRTIEVPAWDPVLAWVHPAD